MDREADLRFQPGPIDYTVGWIPLTFLGVFGVHRMYQGKWITGILYLFTGGLFFIGVLYDFWTLNTDIRAQSRAGLSSAEKPGPERASSRPGRLRSGP